jgi:drug/metabolite transporter (DMT)-like permease
VGGVLLAVVAALLYNTGFILQKAAFRTCAGPPVHRSRGMAAGLARQLFTSPLWMGGLTLTTGGLCCQIVVLSLLPLTVAQPIALCGVVVLLLLSRLLLAERAALRVTTGLVLVVSSMVLMVASLDPTRDRPGAGGRTLVLAAVALPSVLVALVVFNGAHRAARRLHARRRATGAVHGLAAGLLYGVAGLAAKGLAVLVGTATATGAVRAAVVSPYAYLLVAATGLGFLVFQSGLRRYPASIVVPVANIVANLHAVAAGTVVFDERLPASPVRLGLRGAAFAAATAALVLLCTSAAGPTSALGATGPMTRRTVSALPPRERADPER